MDTKTVVVWLDDLLFELDGQPGNGLIILPQHYRAIEIAAQVLKRDAERERRVNANFAALRARKGF